MSLYAEKRSLSRFNNALSFIRIGIISGEKNNCEKTWRVVRPREGQTVKVKGKIPQDNRDHSYCPKCWSECSQSYAAEGREYYRCDRCGYNDSRLIRVYTQMRYRTLPDSDVKGEASTSGMLA